VLVDVNVQALHPTYPVGALVVGEATAVEHDVQAVPNMKYPGAQTTLAIAPEVHVHEAVLVPHVTQRFEVEFKEYPAEQAKQ